MKGLVKLLGTNLLVGVLFLIAQPVHAQTVLWSYTNPSGRIDAAGYSYSFVSHPSQGQVVIGTTVGGANQVDAVSLDAQSGAVLWTRSFSPATSAQDVEFLNDRNNDGIREVLFTYANAASPVAVKSVILDGATGNIIANLPAGRTTTLGTFVSPVFEPVIGDYDGDSVNNYDDFIYRESNNNNGPSTIKAVK